jgi:hypothetical protein
MVTKLLPATSHSRDPSGVSADDAGGTDWAWAESAPSPLQNAARMIVNAGGRLKTDSR